MLRTHLIPTGEGDIESWDRFHDKATSGSYKALDWLHAAMTAFMVDVTGDPASAEKLDWEDFFAMSDDWFPSRCPVQSIYEFRDTAVACGWVQRFRVSRGPRKPATHYIGLWWRFWLVWRWTPGATGRLVCQCFRARLRSYSTRKHPPVSLRFDSQSE